MFARIQGRRPSAGTVLGGLALVVATGGMAIAAVPGGDGTVTACVSGGGSIRIVDAEQGETCPSNQTMVKLAATDAAGKVADADRLDGMDSTDFLGASAKAADADRLDGMDSTDFLGASAKAVDADRLDGMDSTDLLAASALPGKVSRHVETVEVPAGATRSVGILCADLDAVAIGGGVHWGTDLNHHQLAEHITGILNASGLAGDRGWSGVVTNDESVPLSVTAVVLCLNP